MEKEESLTSMTSQACTAHYLLLDVERLLGRVDQILFGITALRCRREQRIHVLQGLDLRMRLVFHAGQLLAGLQRLRRNIDLIGFRDQHHVVQRLPRLRVVVARRQHQRCDYC